MEALAVEGASGVITSALWLQLCRSRLRLQKPEAAEEACATAQRRLPDDEDALVHKVWQLVIHAKPLTTARAQSLIPLRLSRSLRSLDNRECTFTPTKSPLNVVDLNSSMLRSAQVKALILSQKYGEAFAEASSARQRFRNSQQVYQVRNFLAQRLPALAKCIALMTLHTCGNLITCVKLWPKVFVILSSQRGRRLREHAQPSPGLQASARHAWVSQ